MKITTFLHSTKDQMYAVGVMYGLKDDALEYFKYALNEVKIELEVEPIIGTAKIISVDGYVLNRNG